MLTKGLTSSWASCICLLDALVSLALTFASLLLPLPLFLPLPLPLLSLDEEPFPYPWPPPDDKGFEEAIACTTFTAVAFPCAGAWSATLASVMTPCLLELPVDRVLDVAVQELSGSEAFHASARRAVPCSCDRTSSCALTRCALSARNRPFPYARRSPAALC